MKFKKVEINSYQENTEKKRNYKKYLIISIIIIIFSFLIFQISKESKEPKINIKKPLADQNEYKIISLKNNLKVLLISSKETKKSASSLAVNVGSFNDLTPGLAHFCEHMIFLGNNKFPEENLFSNTLSKFQGIYNAYTSKDKTVFFFEVNNNGFSEVFNIFSSMFNQPLFDIKFVKKEINAVNSEHSKNINNNNWIIDFLLRREGSEKNPYWKFSCGNNDTLGRINTTILQKELFSFFNTFYLPKNMKLVLYSNLTIKEMEKEIYNNFNFIKKENNNELIYFKESLEGVKFPVYEKGQIPKIMFFKPSGEENLLSIYFIIDSLYKLYETKPQDYFFYYFNYEGPGSLIYILKENELVIEIKIYVEEMFKDFSIIKIGVLLTEKGIKHYEDIIKLIFSYINLIKNVPIDNGIYNEKKENSDNEFKFFQMKNLYNLVIELSLNMFIYNDENILYGNYLHSIYDKYIIKNFLNEISIDKSVIILGTKNDLSKTKYFEKHVKKILPYYNREYYVSLLNENDIKELKENSEKINSKISFLNNIQFHLRERNEYITKIKNITLPCYEINKNCVDNEFNEEIKNYSPQILDEFNDKKGFYAYFKIDNSFKIPKQNIYISITSNTYKIENAMLNFMIVQYYRILTDYLLFDAKGNGNEIQILTQLNKIIFKINCYSDLSEKIINELKNIIFSEKIEEKVFNQIKSRVPSLIAKRQSELAFRHTLDLFNKIIIDNETNTDDLIQTDLSLITFDKFYNFFNEFKNNLNISLLIHGVTSKLQSKLLSQILYNKMINNEKKIIKEINQKIIKQKSVINYYFQNKYKGETNHVTSIFYQFEKKSDKQKIYMEMFTKCIGNIFFTELRTNKQLGYIVKGSPYEILNQQYYLIIVQGEEKFPDEIDDLINEVVLKAINKNCNNNFNEIKNSIKYQFNSDENNLNEKSKKIFDEIIYKNYDFEKEERLIKVLETIKSYNEVIDYMKNVFEINPKRIGIFYYSNNINENDMNKRIEELINSNKTYSLNKKIKIEYKNKIDFNVN